MEGENEDKEENVSSLFVLWSDIGESQKEKEY